jgi:alkylation response protein AidB-like acyl-CoA dehydrogenase
MPKTKDRELTTQELVARAAEIGPTLREGAEASDRESRLPAASVDAMRDAGFFRMFVPRSLGGLEVDPVTHARVQEEVSRHDSAAGWILQTSISDWWCSRLPTAGVEEIYANGADQIIVGSFGIPAEATPVDGGFRLSGQRPFASNVSDASWIWLTALVMQDGAPVMMGDAPLVIFAYFPANEATIVPTWDTMGMRGTDSNDVLVSDVFVPQHRTFRLGIDHTPGDLYGGPLYRAAVMVTVPTIVPPVALGVAREAIDELIALAAGKTPFASTTTLRERAGAQAKVGRAEGLLRSARAFLYDRVARGWERTLLGEELSLEDRTELLLTCVQANLASAEAVELVYSAAGTSAIYKRNRLERLFRDAQVMKAHGFASESRYETVGQVAMGLPPDLGFVAL